MVNSTPFLSKLQFLWKESVKEGEIQAEQNQPGAPSQSATNAFRRASRYTPLIAALVAPLATLYDIPGERPFFHA